MLNREMGDGWFLHVGSFLAAQIPGSDSCFLSGGRSGPSLREKESNHSCCLTPLFDLAKAEKISGVSRIVPTDL